MDIIPAQRNFRKFCENGAGITYIMERSIYARFSSCLIVIFFLRPTFDSYNILWVVSSILCTRLLGMYYHRVFTNFFEAKMRNIELNLPLLHALHELLTAN